MNWALYEICSTQNTRITYFCTTKGTSQAITKTDWLNTLLGMKRWPLTRQHRKWNWWSVHRFPGWGRGGGELSYKSDRNARRLALGCKLQILVSLRVFGMKSYYICPSRYRLVLCVKKFTKKCPDTDETEIYLRGQFKPHPHWSPGLRGLI